MKTSMDTWYNHWTSTLRTSLQTISFKLERSGSSLEGKEAKKQTIPSKDETRQYGSAWFFFLAELLFLNSHWCPTAQQQIKQLQKGIYFCSGPDCTHWAICTICLTTWISQNAPLGTTFKNLFGRIYTVSLRKRPGEKKQSGRGCSSWEERREAKEATEIRTWLSLFSQFF